jgi:hypothetical protein
VSLLDQRFYEIHSEIVNIPGRVKNNRHFHL